MYIQYVINITVFKYGLVFICAHVLITLLVVTFITLVYFVVTVFLGYRHTYSMSCFVRFSPYYIILHHIMYRIRRIRSQYYIMVIVES